MIHWRSILATVLAVQGAACASIAGIDSIDPAVDGNGRAGAYCGSLPRPTSQNALFFCDDFDEGSLPAPWTSVHQSSGTVAQNNGVAASPPNSLDVAIGPLATAQTINASLRASLGLPPLPSAMTFSFSVDPVRIDTSPNASMVLGAVDFLDAAQNRYTVQLAFDVQGGSPAMVLDELYSDGRPYVPHAITTPLTIGVFTDVSIEIDWESSMTASARFLVNGAQLLSLPLTIGVDARSLQISIGTTYSTEPSTGWEVRYDNVLFSAE
jgi:hypothetical protein